MYYYFINGSNDVFDREEEVDIEEYPQFTELNERQAELHVIHPDWGRAQILSAIAQEDMTGPTIYSVREEKILEIKEYDSSDNVNGFFVGGNIMWLTPAVRDNYMSTLEGAQRLGISGVTFMGIEMTPEQGIMLLDLINVYAMQCVGVTEYHLANVNALETIEDIELYDYTVGYPERLSFFEPQNEEPIEDENLEDNGVIDDNSEEENN